MKAFRLILLLALLGGGGYFIWYGYQVGWLHHPFSASTATTQGAASSATAAADDAGGRRQRGGGGRGGRRGGGNDGPISVLVVPARYQDVPVTLEAVGTIQALNTVTARTQVDGRLMALSFKDGQDVEQGDLIAKIDPTTYQAQLDLSRAKKAQDEALLANAKIDLVRYTKLASSDYGPKQQADTQKSLVAQYEAQVKGDQATIENNQAILAYTTIKSPLSGRTGIRLVDVGNILHASDATGIVTITQMQPIAMIFNLPQQNLLAVNTAMTQGPVTIEALQADNTTVLDKGAVEVVDNQVDQSTGTVKIKAQFPNADRHLWPGQFVNVRVYVSTLKHVVVVPNVAVQRGPNGAYCFVLTDSGSVKQTNIEVGQQDENIAVVKSGVEPPTQVVTTGFARLSDGAKVTATVAPADAPASATSKDAPAATPASGGDGAAAPPAAGKSDGAPRDGGRNRHRRGKGPGQAPAEAAPANGAK